MDSCEAAKRISRIESEALTNEFTNLISSVGYLWTSVMNAEVKNLAQMNTDTHR